MWCDHYMRSDRYMVKEENLFGESKRIFWIAIAGAFNADTAIERLRGVL